VGAPGGWLTLPLTEWNGTPLRYPIGVSDFPELIGKQFDLAAYVRIPQYMFAEDRDDRDAVRGHYCDAEFYVGDEYDAEDARLIMRLFGEDLMERWEVLETLFRTAGASCQFVTYPGVGHELTTDMWDDARSFFEEVLGEG